MLEGLQSLNNYDMWKSRVVGSRFGMRCDAVHCMWWRRSFQVCRVSASSSLELPKEWMESLEGWKHIVIATLLIISN